MGFAKITNIFEGWQIDSLENAFDKFYETRLGISPESTTQRLPLLGAALEDISIARTIAASPYLMSSLRSIAGENCQYVGSDVQLVYDDSIGVHRDTHYDYDMVKILIFLSDSSPGVTNLSPGYRLATSAGGFAVLSGSHVPGSRFSALASQLSDWPRDELSVRADLTTEYLRGDLRSNEDFLYPIHNYDTRYQGFSHIPFQRGDVVIFSTRAFHALLPTHSNYSSKLLGLLFLEDFEKASGRPLETSIHKMSREEKLYITLPYNLRLADNIIKGATYKTAYESFANYPMGLHDLLSRDEPLLEKAFAQHTHIYKLMETNRGAFHDECLSCKDDVLQTFEKNFFTERGLLNPYLEQLESSLVGFSHKAKAYVNNINVLSEGFKAEAWASLASIPTCKTKPATTGFRARIKSLIKRIFRGL